MVIFVFVPLLVIVNCNKELQVCMFSVRFCCIQSNWHDHRLTDRAPKSYAYDADGLRLVYRAVGSEQKVYMEPSSNGAAISASNGRRQNNMVGSCVKCCL